MMRTEQESLREEFAAIIPSVYQSFQHDWIIWNQKPGVARRLLPKNLIEPVSEFRNSKEVTHTATEICVCTRGSMGIRLNDKVLKLNSGELVIIFSGIFHEEFGLSHHDYKSIWLTADPYMLYMHLSGKDEQTGFFTREAVSLGPETVYLKLIGAAENCIRNQDSYYVESLKIHMLQFLIKIVKNLHDAETLESLQKNATQRNLLIVKVMNFIKRNYSNKIQLNDVAEYVFFSPGHLNKTFKQERGETVMQYLENYRITVAKKLLVYTQNSIEEIAAHLSFCDQFHFSKTFKKRVGVSPVQYKKNVNI
jgi:AraC-like DNA-binding protein